MAGYIPDEEEKDMQTGAAPKGSLQWAEQQQRSNGQASAQKGTLQWTEQQANDGKSVQPVAPAQPNAVAPVNTKDVAADANQAKTETEPKVVVDKDAMERQAAVAGLDEQIAKIKEMADESAPETDDEREARERKEKRDKIIAAISDGVAAIGNLVTTGMGGISSYNPNTGSQMEGHEERVEKLRQLRKERQERRDKLQQQLGELEDKRAMRLHEIAQAQEEAKRKAKEEERKASSHKWAERLAELGYRKAAAEADDARNKANISAVNAANAQQMQNSKLATEQSKANSNNARASKYRADANGGGKAKGEFTAYDRQGRPHQFKTKAAADQFAKQQGTYATAVKSDTTVTETKDMTGTHTKTEVRNRTDGYPQVPEKEEQKREQTSATSRGDMPGVSKKSTSKGDMPGASRRE